MYKCILMHMHMQIVPRFCLPHSRSPHTHCSWTANSQSARPASSPRVSVTITVVGVRMINSTSTTGVCMRMRSEEEDDFFVFFGNVHWGWSFPMHLHGLGCMRDAHGGSHTRKRAHGWWQYCAQDLGSSVTRSKLHAASPTCSFLLSRSSLPPFDFSTASNCYGNIKSTLKKRPKRDNCTHAFFFFRALLETYLVREANRIDLHGAILRPTLQEMVGVHGHVFGLAHGDDEGFCCSFRFISRWETALLGD